MQEKGRLRGSPSDPTWARSRRRKVNQDAGKHPCRRLHAEGRKEAPRMAVAVLPKGWLVPPKVS